MKAAYRARAEQIRDSILNGGCMTPSGRVDTTPESRANITGAVLMAVIGGAAFSEVWRKEDNSDVLLDAPGMIGLGLAAGRHSGACFAACFAIKDEITAATTIAAVRDVDLTAGYPA